MSKTRVLIGSERISTNVDFDLVEKLNFSKSSGEMYKKDVLLKA